MNESGTAPGGVAVVTGGAGGLGAAFVQSLASSGHSVATLDLQASRSDDSRLLSTLWHSGDATSAADISRFADHVRTELGPTRVVVNNVGASPYRGFTEETVDGWREVMALNVESAFLTTQEFLPDLVEQADARVINLASSVLWDAESRNMVAYTAAKGAIVGLTRALATELGKHGITVNALAPGIVQTSDTARVPREKLEEYRRRQAIHEIAVPEDLTSSLDYLVSRRSGHVTGTILGINGGRVWL